MAVVVARASASVAICIYWAGKRLTQPLGQNPPGPVDRSVAPWRPMYGCVRLEINILNPRGIVMPPHDA